MSFVGASRSPTSVALFTPISLGTLTLKNRIVVSPMCQYSCKDGVANDWHLAHLGSFAVRGAGLVIVEASAVSPEGRISPHCLGIWNDNQMNALKNIVKFHHAHNTPIGIQLAHAGRKASTCPPWEKKNLVDEANGGWPKNVLGPSPIAWDSTYAVPREVTAAEISRVVNDFASAAKRADAAGFDFIEIHGAHGYLISSFLSPLSNIRKDEYGGCIENRARLLLQVLAAVRKVWNKPLGLRLSCSEWVEGGWDIDDTLKLLDLLAPFKLEMIDCSSGGNNPKQKIIEKPGYQVPFAKQVKSKLLQMNQTNTIVGTVGMITDPVQANEIVQKNEADLVLLARQFLREPNWVLRAANDLGVSVVWPNQYARGQYISKKKQSKL